MTENERIKELRLAKDLTLKNMGTILGISEGAVSNIEKGKRNVTEQIRKAICREFNVDYIWLTTGEGEMFVDTDHEITATIDRILAGENEFHKNILKTITKLDVNELLALESIIDKYIEVKKEGDQRN